MGHTSLLASFVLMFFMSFNLYAVDDPTTVLGTEKYSKEMCIQQTTDNCITTICTTSEDIDCQEKCKQMAMDKCQEEVNE